MAPTMQKSVQLKNHATGEIVYDRLVDRAQESGPCGSSSKICKGSVMVPSMVKPTFIRTKSEILQQAKDFLDEFYEMRKSKNSEEHVKRWEQVQQEVETRGTYDLTYDEIVAGARLAWRNAPRCIGRIQWANLKVFDARHIRTATEMFDALLEHIKYATNNGNLRSTMTLFPQRTDPKKDYRVWNSQLIHYAGYANADGSVTGDPINVEFTQLCQKLGWKAKGTQFDVLPVVLQANGQDPEWFVIPDELVLQVPLAHPHFPWFEELGLRWYALPAVSSMLFDVGGIHFPAIPFNGWYMGTEIGARDLCDVQRYNLTEMVARKMGLDTSNHSTLWKDTVVLEMNKAVLYSYKKKGVTIWDHHSASQSFMQFFGNEMKTRGGCPADWVWLMPPMSSSVCPVFHQEMAFYFLKPSFEYQLPAWKTHEWNNPAFRPAKDNSKRKKLTLKVAAKCALFCASLFKIAVNKRHMVNVLFASESGKSENFASIVKSTLDCLFQVQVKCMADYDVDKLKDEKSLIIVTSTFGSGDSPTNGVQFHQSLQQMLKNKQSIINGHGPPRFATFALGSTAYPHYCSYGKFVDQTLEDLGAKRLMPVCCGDELNGQEQTFRSWLKRMFVIMCKEYLQMEAEQAMEYLGSADQAPTAMARFEMINFKEDLVIGLSQVHNKQVSLARISGKTTVTSANKDHSVLLLQLDTFGSSKMQCRGGDHLTIFPRNSDVVVDDLMRKLKNCPNEDAIVQLKVQNHQSEWGVFHKIPPSSLRTLLSRFVDLNASPTQATLRVLAEAATKKKHSRSLRILSEDWDEYNRWVSQRLPTLTKVMTEFKCSDVDAATLISTLPIIQPRYYSVSSSSAIFPSEIHLTVTLVHADYGGGIELHGLCSSYLNEVTEGEFVACFLRPAPYFHLPKDPSRPILMIGAGSGIAPFRGLWWERGAQIIKQIYPSMQNGRKKISSTEAMKFLNQKYLLCGSNFGIKCQSGPIHLYYGCREKSLQLYSKEVSLMNDVGLIDEEYVALSRAGKEKVYVQDLLWRNGSQVCRQILGQGAHVYVCGSAAMASQVEDKIKKIISHFGALNDDQTQYVFQTLQEEGRYHLDVFG